MPEESQLLEGALEVLIIPQGSLIVLQIFIDNQEPIGLSLKDNTEHRCAEHHPQTSLGASELGAR
jgi:hypothetical protein